MFLLAFAAALSALVPPGDPQPEPPADQAIVITCLLYTSDAADE